MKMKLQLWNSAGCLLDSRDVPAHSSPNKLLRDLMTGFMGWPDLMDGDSIKIVDET